MRLFTTALFLSLPFCQGDETISGYADTGATYRLSEIDGTGFAARATIRFPAEGRVEGQGPCNSYSAAQTVPYPWFQLGSIVSTKRACAELAEETRFFEAIRKMTLAEVQGDVLILSNEAGGEMLFVRMAPG